MGHHQERAGPAGRCVRTRTRRPCTDQRQEPVTEALVPRGLPVGGDLFGQGLEGGLDLGVGIGLELGAQRAVPVVEAQEASIVIAPGPGPRRRGRRRIAQRSRRRRRGAGHLGQVSDRALLGPLTHSWSVSGVATSATARTLSKEMSAATAPPPGAGCPRPPWPPGRTPGRSPPRGRSAAPPTIRPRSHPRLDSPDSARPRRARPRSRPGRPSSARTPRRDRPGAPRPTWRPPKRSDRDPPMRRPRECPTSPEERSPRSGEGEVIVRPYGPHARVRSAPLRNRPDPHRHPRTRHRPERAWPPMRLRPPARRGPGPGRSSSRSRT